MNNETRELNINELDNVSGGNPVLVGIALGVAGNAVYDYMKEHQGLTDAINYIKQQAGK
jgi:bacteriocin-like protein